MAQSTRKRVEWKVQRLNAMLNRPMQAYTFELTDDGTRKILHANVGHFLLSTWAPGDGWTRYTLSEIVNVNGGESNVTASLNIAEMHAYLSAILDVLNSQEYTCTSTGFTTFAKYPEVRQ